MTEQIRFTYNYRNRRWRMWYIIALGSVAAVWFDNIMAGVLVILATVDVEVDP